MSVLNAYIAFSSCRPKRSVKGPHSYSYPEIFENAPPCYLWHTYGHYHNVQFHRNNMICSLQGDTSVIIVYNSIYSSFYLKTPSTLGSGVLYEGSCATGALAVCASGCSFPPKCFRIFFSNSHEFKPISNITTKASCPIFKTFHIFSYLCNV